MIEDDFYATIKFKNGEEVFTKVAASEEEERTMLILSNPIMIEEITVRGKLKGYKIEPWLKTTSEDMFIISMEDILTMTESTDIEMILTHEDYLKKRNQQDGPSKPTRDMGYISTVDEAKKILEKLYNNS